MFNEAENLPPLVERLLSTLEALETSFEVILVNDGSRDGTWERIQEAAAADSRIKGLLLARNFGHQNALFAGLHHSQGRAVVTMDGDLQHPPEVIAELHAAWRSGNKVVTTRRHDSGDTPTFKRLTSRWFYRLFSLLTGLPLTVGNSDFRLIDRQVLKTLVGMRETSLFLRGMVQWVGFSTASVSYRAHRRQAGSTKYNLRRMLRFSLGAIVSFSSVPLRLGIWVGLLMSLVAFSEIVYVLYYYSIGNTVPGWASVVVFMSLMFGILFLLLGVMGIYLANIHEMLKNRPLFVIDKTLGIGE